MQSQDPGKSSGRGDAWNWVRLDKKAPTRGWLAGPIFGARCHHFKGTRGCPALLTGGKVPCGHDHNKYVPEWKGYVPFWDELGVRCFVVINEAWFELAQKIPHLGELWIVRTDFHGSPIKVYGKPWAREEPPISNLNKRPQDIRPFLLRLWGDKELAAHFRKHPMKPLPAPAVGMLDAAHTRAEITAEVLARRRGEEPATLGSVLKTMEHPNGRNGKRGAE